MTTINGTPVTSPLSNTTTDIIPRPSRSRRATLLTFADAVDHLLRVEEINPNEPRAVERAQIAVQTAMNSFVTHSSQGFRYYNATDHIVVEASATLGTMTIASGVVTPVTATFPSWIDFASLRVNQKSYPVKGYTASTLTIDAGLADGTYTGTSFDHSSIRLPADYRRRGSLTDGSKFWPIVDVPGGALQSYRDYYQLATANATSRVFAATTGDQRFQGELMLAIWPPFASRTELSLFYERYPARCDTHRFGTGLMDVTGTTVTTVDSILTSDHVGSALVMSTDGAEEIRSSLSSRTLIGAQRIITAVASATSCTIDNTISASPITGRTFYISDVVDVMPGPSTDALLRLAEYEVARGSKLTKYSKSLPARWKEFRNQMDIAQVDDSRYRDSVDYLPTMGFSIGDVTGRPDL